MNVIDKVVAAVTPSPSPEKMQDARATARALAGKTGWLTAILEHHVQIETCFAEVKNATSETGRKKAQKQLALVLTHRRATRLVVDRRRRKRTDRLAVAHHVYEEESDYFPKLMQAADTSTQSKLTRKYKEEYERYVHPVV